MKIPKHIHFIWAGGTRKLPAEYARNIKLWGEQNPGFNVMLWIDERTDPHAKAYYTTEQAAGRLPSNAQLADIEEQNVSSPHTRYEIERLKPNYGKSSDQLRYRILQKFGGAYFDSDIVPSDTPLAEHEAFTRDWDNHHCLYVDPDSQGTGVIGNDGFISTPDNPIMGRLSEFCEASYRGLSAARSLVRDTEHEEFNKTCKRVNTSADLIAYDQDHHIFLSTIQSTGPGAVRSVIGSRVSAETSEYLGSIIIPMHDVAKPMDNKPTGKWRSIPVALCDDLDEAIDKARLAMAFETEHMGILRLDDHVENVMDSIKHSGSKLNREHVTRTLASHAEGHLLPQIKHAQLTFCNPVSEKCLSQLGIFPDRVMLFPFQGDLNEEAFAQTFGPFKDHHLQEKDYQTLDPSAQEKVCQGIHLVGLMIRHDFTGKLQSDPSRSDSKYFCVRQLCRTLEICQSITSLPIDISERAAELQSKLMPLEMKMRAASDHERKAENTWGHDADEHEDEDANDNASDDSDGETPGCWSRCFSCK